MICAGRAVERDGSYVSITPPYEDMTIGPGSARLLGVQSFDDERGILYSPSFDVVGVSAAQVEGAPERFCLDDDPPPTATGQRRTSRDFCRS